MTATNAPGGAAVVGAATEQPQLFPTPQTERTSDDYWTPKWIFDAIGLTFDLDVACPPEGPAHTPCLRYYTQADDGLTQPWHGTVWMNPPFSASGLWVQKWLHHANGICLTVMSKSKWYDKLWNGAHGCIALPPTLKFDNPHGTNGSIFIPCALWALGNKATTALANSGIGKMR